MQSAVCAPEIRTKALLQMPPRWSRSSYDIPPLKVGQDGRKFSRRNCVQVGSLAAMALHHMLVHRRVAGAVAAQRVVAGDLRGAQYLLRLQMRGEMDGAQAGLQRADLAGQRGQFALADAAAGELLVERAPAGDDL